MAGEHDTVSYGLHSDVCPRSISHESVHLIWSPIAEFDAAGAREMIEEGAKKAMCMTAASSANSIESEDVLVEKDRQSF